MKLSLRPMTAADRRYVVPTWALSSRYGGLKKTARFAMVDRIIDAGARVLVYAHDRTVHAWACGEPGVLHYVYVPPELRGEGLARELITHLLGEYPERVHVTHEWPRPSQRFRFAPFLLHREAA